MVYHSYPSYLTTCTRRDASLINQAYIQNDLATQSTIDDNNEHRYNQLHTIYTPNFIIAYDIYNIGSMATTTLVASEVQLTAPVTS